MYEARFVFRSSRFHPWENTPKSILLHRQVCRRVWAPLNADTHSFSSHTKPVRNSSPKEKKSHLSLTPWASLSVTTSSGRPHKTCASTGKKNPTKTHPRFQDKSQVEKLLRPYSPMAQRLLRRRGNARVLCWLPIYLFKYPSSDKPGLWLRALNWFLIWVASVSRRFLAAFDPGES